MSRRGSGLLDQPLKTSLAVRMVAWQKLGTLRVSVQSPHSMNSPCTEAGRVAAIFHGDVFSINSLL